MPGTGRVDDAVLGYIDELDPQHRPLFNRVHRLILSVHPEAHVVMSYKMPSYKVGRRRLYMGAWQHGVSIYGWRQDRDGGFVARHPELKTSKGTIQLRSRDADAIPDDEILALVGAALED
jgi:uncharacterized protein YdhG (YjbR/CyaY superfamily)